MLAISGLRDELPREGLRVHNATRDAEYAVRHRLSSRQVEVLRAGGLVPWLREHGSGTA